MTLYFYAASWNTAWNSSVRCSDSASKYRCGQREPPLPFNYLRWTAQTGRSASQHIKINTGRMTSGALRRAFPSSFILPGLCSGPWTQGRGPRPVGTHRQRSPGANCGLSHPLTATAWGRRVGVEKTSGRQARLLPPPPSSVSVRRRWWPSFIIGDVADLCQKPRRSVTGNLVS